MLWFAARQGRVSSPALTSAVEQRCFCLQITSSAGVLAGFEPTNGLLGLGFKDTPGPTWDKTPTLGFQHGTKDQEHGRRREGSWVMTQDQQKPSR